MIRAKVGLLELRKRNGNVTRSCKMTGLGWRPDELFGLHPDAPMGRYDRMGLIWMLKGKRVMPSQPQRRGCQMG